MLKNLLKGLIVGGAMLAVAMPAASNAQIREINIFGASAQYKYWTEGAPQFLKDAMACADSDIGHAQTEDAGPDGDRDAGIAICDSDSEADGVDLTAGSGNNAGAQAAGYVGDTIIIRYTTFASAEGVYAGLGTNPSNTDSACATDERLMADETTTTWTGIGTIPAPDGGVTTLACQDITLGTSDIDPQCFTQATYGPKKSSTFGTPGLLADWQAAAGSIFGSFDKRTCRDCDTWWVREFTPIAVDSAAYDVFNPIIVPFSFFVNEATLGGTVTNLTRPMAQMLFSQQVTNWDLFGYASQDVAVCIRHAGSGTHATLDWAVVRPAALAQLAYHPDESAVVNGNVPATYTNKGSSDEVACVAAYPGAVGYADSDKKGDSVDPCESGVCRTDYQGFTGNRANIRQGLYDFWGANYVVATKADAAKDEVIDLMNYMSNPTNLDATGKFEWWASQGEMDVTRGTCKEGIKKK